METIKKLLRLYLKMRCFRLLVKRCYINFSIASVRLFTADILILPEIFFFNPLRLYEGITAAVKPIFTASAILFSIWPTLLTSPPKPTSPITTVRRLTGFSSKFDAMLQHTARSAAGSIILTPPAILINTLFADTCSFALFSSTANRMESLL